MITDRKIYKDVFPHLFMEKITYNKQYVLKCKEGQYEQLKIALDQMNSICSQKNERGWEQYLILDEKPITIKLLPDFSNISSRDKEKGIESVVQMAIGASSKFEPKFIKEIAKKLEGNSTGWGHYQNSSLIDLFIK